MTLLNGSAETPPPSYSPSSLELNFSVFDPSPSAFSSLTSSNCTDSSSDSSPPYNFYAVLLVLLIFCVVFGNVLVCVAVSRERALQTTTNYLIVSLAVSDLLLATLVMPWGVYLEVCVRGDAGIRPTYCGKAETEQKDIILEAASAVYFFPPVFELMEK